MITFWSSNYNQEELALVKECIEDTISSLREKVNCFETDICLDCKGKHACADLHAFSQHLDEIM